MTKFLIELRHAPSAPTEAPETTTVEIDATECFEDHYVEMVKKAQKNVASRHVDYESFGNDSAYLERIDQVAAEFLPLSATVVSDAPVVRYAVNGEYTTDEQGRWSDWVFATSPAEAEFAAKWTMAMNEDAKPWEPENFEGIMQDITISDCDPEPVTLDEAKAFMGTISRMVIPGDADFNEGGDDGDAEALQALVRQARDMLAGKHATA